MSKKKQRVIQHDNVVVFPGTIQMLLREGHRLAENYQYEEAIQYFEKAFLYEAGDEQALSAYAYALYETKAYDKAKNICEQLLMNTTMYVEVMELYITICMQQKEYYQVEELITILLEERVLPATQIEKFERLRKLNREIADNLQKKEEAQQLEAERLEGLATFSSLPLHEQVHLLHRLATSNVRPFQKMLKQIIERSETHPFIQSMALLLLVEQEVSIDITLTKFQHTATVNPIHLALPHQLPQFQEIQHMIVKQLEQDPSTLEMVQSLVARHAITAYPFEWCSFEPDDVAYSYIDYVQMMLGKVQEMDYDIIEFLQMLDSLSELS
ncbi:tetratricopeptide repeat protein [Lysinibacillus piscis]|uniref:Tetratricopeptide repeat protein n=1 Tax=Lysinibacillus piscis TaxID=2518931 RepID=A0ABQ5NJ46_9BACI|nr:tetratricopeptide repeat protein [Lysinibacillus sp. KH24]GLC88396.1 hypothetical protein LYSBPC_15230 [Lysinibacillus sp. KH24]